MPHPAPSLSPLPAPRDLTIPASEWVAALAAIPAGPASPALHAPQGADPLQYAPALPVGEATELPHPQGWFLWWAIATQPCYSGAAL